MTDHSKPIPRAPEDWPPSLKHVLDDMKGRPLNVHGLMAHHPDLLAAWWNFRNHSVNGGALGKRAGELVILRTAVHLRAWYEWASHVERSLACGLTMAEIEAVKAPQKKSDWAEADRLLLLAVDELFASKAIDPATLAQLNAHYSVPQLMDIMAIHGMYVILGCMINTWGLELDAHVRENLPSQVTPEAFEAEFPKD